MQSTSLATLAHQHLILAGRASSGRSAHTVHGGRDHALRQTVLALCAGHQLADHDSPGEATLQVLQGRVRLTASEAGWEGGAGDFLVIPPERHNLVALEDAVILLTVVTGTH